MNVASQEDGFSVKEILLRLEDKVTRLDDKIDRNATANQSAHDGIVGNVDGIKDDLHKVDKALESLRSSVATGRWFLGVSLAVVTVILGALQIFMGLYAAGNPTAREIVNVAAGFF